MITGQHIREARRSLLWVQKELARNAKVPLSVVVRAENSSGEPMVTIAQLNALLQVLRTAGASFPPPDDDDAAS